MYDDDYDSQSISSLEIDKRDQFKRNCFCRTFLTARNSKHRGRLRKYCNCLNKK